MLSRIYSATTYGLEAKLIEIEVDIRGGQLPSFSIVGMAEKSIQEARERVSSALKNSKFEFPQKKVTINMAPAEIPKNGAQFDIAIGIGILASLDQVFISPTQLFIGELSLDGMVRPVQNVLSIAELCQKHNIKEVYIPKDNCREASLIPGITIFGVASLLELYLHLANEKPIDQYSYKHPNTLSQAVSENYEYDFATIKGQLLGKRACEITAAGGHNILFYGTPGSGKTMLARAIPSILPQMTLDECLEVTRIYSSIGQISYENPLIVNRPFRAPHHSSSSMSIIGGGKIPKPGEVSLAHRGILFLDEFPEFNVLSLEALRQPLEDLTVTIARVYGTIQYPSNFILVAAMNPCKCGWKDDSARNCICTPFQIQHYRRKISGPILDRIDLQVSVKRSEIAEITDKDITNIESSVVIRERVQKARDIQIQRYKNIGIVCNADIKQKHLTEYCHLNTNAEEVLKLAATRLNLSARSYFRIIKVSRTIADLAESDMIERNHILEALNYRMSEEE